MYAAEVKGKRLNFCVSGMLWNRSLVMQDLETKSFWSHILGTCEDGELKGEKLAIIPSVITTWKDWVKRNPETSVLNLSRTSKSFRREFYKEPRKFVFGFQHLSDTLAFSCQMLSENKFASGQVGELPVLATFDPENFAAFAFDRNVDGKTLTFTLSKNGNALVDNETESRWDLATGKAIGGPMAGKALAPAQAIISYRRAWEKFHLGGEIVD